MPDIQSLDLHAAVAILAASGAVVLLCGVRLTRLAEGFAARSGIGEAVTGAVVLGALTSLPGSITSVSAAAAGHPALATSNAIGGIAAQTMFLVIGDLAYRRANLEHAAASLPNILSGSVLMVLLGLLPMAALLPPVSVAGVHPLTPALFLIYGLGVRAADRSGRQQNWIPRQTSETSVDQPDENARRIGVGLPLVLAILGLGAVAVRRGALALAVGGILGGNAFDVLFMAFSDIAYRPGSIYHTMPPDQIFLVLLAMVMTAVLIFGLLHRERRGIANIGFESVSLIVLYTGGVAALVWAF